MERIIKKDMELKVPQFDKEFKVTIVISTKDRVNELQKCLDSCLLLTDVFEILVYDDGSIDNTFIFVKNNYPSVSLYRGNRSIGLINARTKCAFFAKGNILISIDDDCVFQNSSTISEILPFFNHSRVAVVTIPCIDVFINPNSITQEGVGGLETLCLTTQFRGCAHAIRRDVFLEMGGYYDNLIRQEEETDLSLRLWKEGYNIRIGNCSQPILHYHSSIRNENMISFYRSRNQFLVNYRLIPLALFPIFASKQLIQTFIHEVRNRRIRSFFKGLKSAIIEITTGKVKRQPIGYRDYLAYKKLRVKGKLIYHA